MIDTKKLFNLFKKKKINFFSGVPDSCMNEFCNELSNHKNVDNIIAANEGSAVSLGIGYHLAMMKNPLKIPKLSRYCTLEHSSIQGALSLIQILWIR
mgnify:CR=1 FL=1